MIQLFLWQRKFLLLQWKIVIQLFSLATLITVATVEYHDSAISLATQISFATVEIVIQLFSLAT